MARVEAPSSQHFESGACRATHLRATHVPDNVPTTGVHLLIASGGLGQCPGFLNNHGICIQRLGKVFVLQVALRGPIGQWTSIGHPWAQQDQAFNLPLHRLRQASWLVLETLAWHALLMHQ